MFVNPQISRNNRKRLCRKFSQLIGRYFNYPTTPILVDRWRVILVENFVEIMQTRMQMQRERRVGSVVTAGSTNYGEELTTLLYIPCSMRLHHEKRTVVGEAARVSSCWLAVTDKTRLLHPCRGHAFLSSPLHFPRYFPNRLVETPRGEIHSRTSPNIHRLRTITLHPESSITFVRHTLPSHTSRTNQLLARRLTLRRVLESYAVEWISGKAAACSRVD